MYWTDFRQPTGHVQQNIFVKTLIEVCSPHLYAAFGTFWVPIGQLFVVQWVLKQSEEFQTFSFDESDFFLTEWGHSYLVFALVDFAALFVCGFDKGFIDRRLQKNMVAKWVIIMSVCSPQIASLLRWEKPNAYSGFDGKIKTTC